MASVLICMCVCSLSATVCAFCVINEVRKQIQTKAEQHARVSVKQSVLKGVIRFHRSLIHQQQAKRGALFTITNAKNKDSLLCVITCLFINLQIQHPNAEEAGFWRNPQEVSLTSGANPL